MDGTQPICATVTVRSDPVRAFELFTAQMGKWWPLESYSRAVSEFEHEDVGISELMFDARMGGSILERMTDGRVLPWAEVVAWQPPRRVVLSRRPHSKPEPPTELEVTSAVRGDGTSIEVEHRGWERLSEEFRAGLYEIYERGWPFTLECLAPGLRTTSYTLRTLPSPPVIGSAPPPPPDLPQAATRRGGFAGMASEVPCPPAH